MSTLQRAASDIYSAEQAKAYAKYRWDYAPEAVKDVVKHTGLARASCVADIGSGTGILTRHFLGQVKQVWAVEPNPLMRQEAEAELGRHPGFFSVAAQAECTTLPTNSIDVVVVGQALHWFEPQAALPEFRRILKPNGWLAVFNYKPSYSSETNAVLQRYLQPIWSTWPRVQPKGTPADYLQPGYITLSYPCTSDDTWERFIGSAQSAAAAPQPGSPGYDEFYTAYERVFAELNTDGILHLGYTTCVALGKLIG